jgi:hypothetical protein
MRCGGGAIVIARCEPTALFSFLEGAFDEIVNPVYGLKQIGLLRLFPREIGPRRLLDGEFSDPIAEATLVIELGLDDCGSFEKVAIALPRAACARRVKRALQRRSLRASPRKNRDKHFGLSR